MKKCVLSLGLGLALATGVVSADSVLEQLNTRVTDMLSPYQNQATRAQLIFNAVETNETRAVKVAVNGLYRKTGSQNTFELKIDNISYNYTETKDPVTVFKGSLGIDFTKLLPQEQINMLIPEASDILEELAQNYTEEEYGDAASFRSVITSTSKDTDDNYTSLTALVSAKIDLSRLPEETDKESVRFTDVVMSFAIDLKKGVMIDAYLVSNPDYIGFAEEEQGLKEILDGLLSGDEERLEDINGFVQLIDQIAGQVVEMTNELQSRMLTKFLPKKS